MAHISKEELLRVSASGRAEVEHMALHLSVCPGCRALVASLLVDRATPAKFEAPLRTLLELADFEREAAIEQLLARVELVELRKLPRGAQKERVIQSRACHTTAFLNVLLAALRAPNTRADSEFLSNLAVLAVQRSELKQDSAEFKSDLLAAIWIETGNARRINGEWNHAQTALLRAKQHLESGTGNPSIQARRLSVLASLCTDQGKRADALRHLEECRSIYEHRGEWPLVARTLVQMAHCVVDDDPERGLALLDSASVLIPAEDAGLRWLSESSRTECLITLRRMDDALSAFEHAERLRSLHNRPNARLRSTFTTARLLEGLGKVAEAGILFDEVVAGDLEQGLYKDAFLDLLYVVGFHVHQGSPERAVEIGLRTLDDIDRQDAAVHGQLRTVWEKLIEAAQGETLDDQMLAQVRGYLRAHWKNPAPTEPVFVNQDRTPSASVNPAAAYNEKLVGSLLARARWSLIRRETRKQQQLQVARSPECHTRAFIEVMLADISTAMSREESEFIASLAVAAVQAMEEPTSLKHDLQAQVWIEVANVRRIGAEWNRALAALRRADEHLSHAAGNLLVQGKRQSVEASLRADQGSRAEAVAMLERCLKTYETLKAWPFAARTLVQMAHTLVDVEPERGLALLEKAMPMIPADDSVLRWLAESIRTESLIAMKEVGQALQAFHLAESLRDGQPRADAARRSAFTAARLLEALGYKLEAERLFDAAITDAFEQEAFREAFLDLLYVYGFHIRAGGAEKAVAVCRFAIAKLDLFEIGHEQLRTVWVELLNAAQQRTVRLEALAEVRAYLQAHWKYPAAKAPSVALTG